MDKRLKKLKEEYHNIPIPFELETIVNEAIQQVKPRRFPNYMKPILVAAAATLLFSISVNISPALAKTLSDIPVIGKLVEVVTIMDIKEESEHNSSVDIQTPAIHGLENPELENNINHKYIEESKQLYADYRKLIASLKDGEDAHTAIQGGYEILTDNDIILSIRRYTEITQASASVENKFDTIDKEYEIVLTLKSLFKNDHYVEIISEEIKAQMYQQMKQDENKVYWIKNDDIEPFTAIKQDQSFYINSDNKLVIAFDELEVAPGYMGAVEFVIPTEKIASILVGNRYIH